MKTLTIIIITLIIFILVFFYIRYRKRKKEREYISFMVKIFTLKIFKQRKIKLNEYI